MQHLTTSPQTLDWNQLNRFLLIGNALGGYDAPLPDLRRTPTPVLDRCLGEDGVRVVRLAANLLVSGRPYRPEPALFAIARALAIGDAPTRQEALELLPIAARSGAHLFQLVDYMDPPSGWSPALRAAVGRWYSHGTAVELVNVLLRSPREGTWSHRDILGFADARPVTKGQAAVFNWIAHRTLSGPMVDDPALELLSAYELLQTTTSEAVVAALLRRWPHLREDVPVGWLTSPLVWREILPGLSSDALVRWLPRLANTPLLHAEGRVRADLLQRLRLGGLSQAPLAPVIALKALGAVRDACQRSDQPRSEALESALLELFQTRVRAVRRTGSTLVIAIDPAASTAPDGLPGLPGLAPRTALAAVALMAANAAERVHVLAFGKTLTPIALAPDERLDTLIAKLEAVTPGRVDGAAPIDWAVQQSVEADAFVILSGTRPVAAQPEAAFVRYRDMVGRRATWLGVSTGPHRLCQAPPSDLNMMEAHGLDAGLPALILDLLGEAA